MNAARVSYTTEVRARILIVEDDAIVALDARRIVEDAGHEVVAVCSSAEQALDAVSARPVDIALVDIRLRGPMDGVTLAEELYVCAGLAVVFVSAFGDPATLARATQAGAYGFVTKPYSPSALASALTIALSKHEEVRRTAGQVELQHLALNQTSAAVVVTRSDGVIRFVNRAAAQLLDSPSIMLVGRNIGALLAGVEGWASVLGHRPAGPVKRVDPPDASPLWATVTVTAQPSREVRAVWTLAEFAPHE